MIFINCDCSYIPQLNTHFMSVCDHVRRISKLFLDVFILTVILLPGAQNEMHKRLITLEVFHFRSVMAGVDPPTCYTCDVVRGKKNSPAEVWYEKVQHWACLECHLTEKALQKVKGKGTVEEIQHTCSNCDRPESTPCCFCYDCSLYLCQTCTEGCVCVRNTPTRCKGYRY